MGRPLLLGEAPAKDGVWMLPLSTDAGRRLFDLTGLEPLPGRHGGPERWYQQLREHFDVLNCVERYEDAYPWNIDVQRQAWDRWTHHLVCDVSDGEELTVVALGRRAGRTVGINKSPWFQWVNAGLLHAVMIPHPSGLNRMYNVESNRDAARRVLEEAMERASSIT